MSEEVWKTSTHPLSLVESLRHLVSYRKLHDERLLCRACHGQQDHGSAGRDSKSRSTASIDPRHLRQPVPTYRLRPHLANDHGRVHRTVHLRLAGLLPDADASGRASGCRMRTHRRLGSLPFREPACPRMLGRRLDLGKGMIRLERLPQRDQSRPGRCPVEPPRSGRRRPRESTRLPTAWPIALRIPPGRRR
jgi:hypothetical protein